MINTNLQNINKNTNAKKYKCKKNTNSPKFRCKIIKNLHNANMTECKCTKIQRWEITKMTNTKVSLKVSIELTFI